MNEEASQLMWTIVAFDNQPESDSNSKSTAVSVVPVEWIFENDDQTYCFWPKVKPDKIRKYIKKALPHEETWDRFQVELLLDKPVSYKEALNIEKKQADTKERNDENEDIQESNKCRKRKRKEDPNFVCLSDLTSDDNVPPPPKIRSCLTSDSNTFVPPPPKIHSCASDDTLSISSVILMPPPDVPILKENEGEPSFDNNQTPVKSLSNNQNEADDIIIDFVNDGTVQESYIPQDENHRQIIDKLDRILKTTLHNRILLQRIISHLNETHGTGAVSVCPNMDLNNIIKEPFRKFSVLLKFDKRVQEDEDLQKHLETLFMACGGTLPKENVTRGLKKIFTDKLSRRCSWYGRKQNFPIGNLKIMDILKAAVRKNFRNNVSDQNFQLLVSNWMRQANLRYNRNRAKPSE